MSNDEDKAPRSSGTSNGEEGLDIIYEVQYQDLQASDEQLQPRARFLADWTKVVKSPRLWSDGTSIPVAVVTVTK